MRELTKSMMSYTWALSVFSVQQVLNLLTPGQGTQQTAKAKQAFDNVTDATTGTFDQTLRSMFGAGDKLQQQMVDAMFGGLTGGSLDPNRWVRMGNDAIKKVADLTRQSAQNAPNMSSGPAPAAAPRDASEPASSGQGSSAPPQDMGWGPMPGQ